MRPARTIALALTTALAAVLPASTAPAAPGRGADNHCTVAAAGDVAGADDYETGAARTAELILREDPGTVIALGDLAYSNGTAEEFAAYYRPTWGRLADRTEAVAGNHEYRTAGADGMEAELGEASNDNRAVTLCGWRLVFLNQYKGIDQAADYLEAERSAHPSAPMLVAWHEPRFSSGSEHGSDESMQPLWAAARANGVRVVLTAHDHNYERFAPMDVNGTATDSGTRQFVSGLGGHGIRELGDPQPNSERRYTGHPAVLFLTLRPSGGYTWALKRDDGALRDWGLQTP